MDKTSNNEVDKKRSTPRVKLFEAKFDDLIVIHIKDSEKPYL